MAEKFTPEVTRADTDVRDVIADGIVAGLGTRRGTIADHVLAALAEAGLSEAKLNDVISGRTVVVAAEDVAELERWRAVPAQLAAAKDKAKAAHYKSAMAKAEKIARAALPVTEETRDA